MISMILVFYNVLLFWTYLHFWLWLTFVLIRPRLVLQKSYCTSAYLLIHTRAIDQVYGLRWAHIPYSVTWHSIGVCWRWCKRKNIGGGRQLVKKWLFFSIFHDPAAFPLGICKDLRVSWCIVWQNIPLWVWEHFSCFASVREWLYFSGMTSCKVRRAGSFTQNKDELIHRRHSQVPLFL